MEAAERLRTLLGLSLTLPKDLQSAQNRQTFLCFVRNVLLHVDVTGERRDVSNILNLLRASDVLRELTHAVTASIEGFRKLALVELFSAIMTRDFLGKLFQESLSCGNTRTTCLALTNLPSKLANELKSELPAFFGEARYLKFLSSALMKQLKKMTESLRQNVNINYSIVSMLLGLLARHHQEAVEPIIPFMLESSDDFVFRTVAQRVVRGVPAELKENVVALICYKTPCYKQIDWLLEDSVITNSNMKHILVDKLLLGRYFTCDRVMKNVMGYLLSSPARKEIACRAAVEVFHAWADKVLMRHQNMEQQYYLTSALMVLCGFVQAGFKLDAESEQLCVKACLHGVQSHLGDPDETLRNFGMIVGQEFLGAVKSEVKKPEFPIGSGYEKLFSYLKTPEEVVGSQTMDVAEKFPPPRTAVDSDDDSEPDDDDDDIVYKIDPKCKIPLYLRDCLQLLVPGNDGENVEQIKICLEHLPALIRKFPGELKNIAEQLCRLVLFAEEAPRVFPKMPAMKREVLVLLLIHAPVISSTYLINTFFSIHVNHRHRMEILSAIMLASDRFTSEDPSVEPKKKIDRDDGLKVSNIKKNLDKLVTGEGKNVMEWTSDWDDLDEASDQVLKKHWKVVVEERIAGKTRKIASKTEVRTKENRFGEVAGYFFYPLMRKCDAEVPMKLEDEDSFLLVKLLQTLGVVMNSARLTPQAYQMGKSLLQFCGLFRYHEHEMIRQACAFAVGSVLSSVPENLLEEHLSEDCSALDEWLRGEIKVQVPEFDMKLPSLGSEITVGPTMKTARRIQELN